MENLTVVNKKMFEHCCSVRKIKSCIATYQETIPEEVISEIMKKGCFYEFIPNGIELCVLSKKYFNCFEKFIRFKEISVYEGEINVFELHRSQKEVGRFYRLADKLIELENKVAELSKDKCEKIYMIHKKHVDISSVDNPRLRLLYDCKLTEQVIFIGIPN